MGRPLPEAIKRLNGGDGIHDSGGRVIQPTPQPVIGSPDIPKSLTGEARKAWITFAQDMEGMGVLSHADRAAMILLCKAWAVMADCNRHVKKEGIIVTLSNGVKAKNPYLKLYQEEQKVVIKLLAHFGLTPSSRSQIKISPPIDGGDEFGDLMEIR
jgi:P27 family predicted phage terminase small subunit